VNFPTDRSGKKQVKVAFKKTSLFQIAFNIKRERGRDTNARAGSIKSTL